MNENLIAKTELLLSIIEANLDDIKKDLDGSWDDFYIEAIEALTKFEKRED